MTEPVVSPQNRSVGLFLVVLLLVVAASFLLSRTLFPPPADPMAGMTADVGESLVEPPIPVGGDWELQSIQSGESVSLSSLRGKAVFVNIWATWCPPCVAELPSIASLYARFKDDPNVAFVLASSEEVDVVRAFLDQNGYEIPVYIAQGPEPSSMASNGIPITFILDKEQNIRLRHLGSTDWDSESVAKLLRQLSAQTVAAAAP